jgi:hypothetical protein
MKRIVCFAAEYSGQEINVQRKGLPRTFEIALKRSSRMPRGPFYRAVSLLFHTKMKKALDFDVT